MIREPVDQFEADAPDAPSRDEQPTTEGSAGSTLGELVETVIFIVLVFFIVRGLVQNFRIEGESMQATLHDRQYILVNKVIYFHFDTHAPLRLLPGNGSLEPRFVYPFRTPKRGDIVVVEAPGGEGDSQRDYIKRVIGLPGETVQIKKGNVYINDEQLDEPYLNTSTSDCGGTGVNPGLCEPYVVPEGTVVLLGDNRNNSQDSRSWGAPPGLPLDRVVGKAWVSYWPRTDWGVIPSPVYARDQ